MATTLQDFGYNTLTDNGAEAGGHRPLLVVLASWLGGPSLAHSVSYYDQLVFNWANTSVNGYYMDISNGRFQWSRAGDVVGPVVLSYSDFQLDFYARTPKIMEAVAASGYDFRRVNDDADDSVTANECAVLVIDTGSTNSASTTPRATHAYIAGSFPGLNVDVKVSFVGQRASLMLIAHELSHQLGTFDLYGHDESRNYYCTLMGANTGQDDLASFHLDPWHKMRLGWSEPRVQSLDSYGVVTLPAANAHRPDAPVILFDESRGTGEYFIIEYRTSASSNGNLYDAAVPSNGLAIWHVRTDANREPPEIAAVPPAAGTDRAVFLDGAPDFTRGGNTLWASEQLTPPLRWLDGSSSDTKLQVHPFNAKDDHIVVELMPAYITDKVPGDTTRHGLPNDPRNEPVPSDPTRHGLDSDPRFGPLRPGSGL